MSAVDRFRHLLRIESVSSEGPANGSYFEAVGLLSSWMKEIGMQNIQIKEFVNHKPVLVGSILGSDPLLPSILLNGHYDVVPVDRSGWTVDPFSAELRSDGRIIARGSQDMKCVLVQYLEALRLLKQAGWKPKRSIHVSFLPDEEVGGRDGASLFVQSSLFKDLNVGLALDEGLANPRNSFSVYYGERASNWVILRAKGPAGHGSRFVKDTAIEKIVRILTRIYTHRSEEEQRCIHHELKLGDVLSMNVTALRAGVPSSVLRGGFAVNVIPTEAEIAIDIRVPLHIEDIEEIIREKWIQDEDEIEIEYVDKNMHPKNDLLASPVEKDKWIKALFEAVGSTIPEVSLELEVFPAGTDGRFIRRAGVPCIGFSPIRNTPILLHDHDEFIFESGFVEGITVYVETIKSFCDIT
jgi:aminoacylase